MENRDYILDRLKSKTMSIDEFNYDRLQAPPISSMFTPQDIAELNRLARSLKYAAKPDVKLREIDAIMRRRGFVKFIGGTNRIAYRPIENNTFLVKVAIDAVGCGDNPREFQNQFLFKPFVCKVFEVTPCGTLGVFERVNPITSREEFLSVAEDIYYVISNWFIGEYVLEDFGTKFFMNWAIRTGFGPVLIDFPYVYKLDGDKLYCNAPDPSSPTGCCDGVIDYDPGYNFLYCTCCNVRYRARELAKAVEENKVLVKSEGDVKMKVRVYGGDKNVNKVQETGDYADMAKSIPAGVNGKRVPVYTSGPKKGKVAYPLMKDQKKDDDTPKITASLKVARPNVRGSVIADQSVIIPEYVEKQHEIKAKITREPEVTANEAAALDVANIDVTKSEEYKKLQADNENLHILIRGLKMDLEGMTLRAAEMEEARNKAASDHETISKQLEEARVELSELKKRNTADVESPVSFNSELKGKTPYEQLDAAAGEFREAVDNFLNLHQFEGDQYTEDTVSTILEEYFQAFIQAIIPQKESHEEAESPINFNDERKNMTLGELVVANADALQESVNDYYNIMHSSEEEILDITKVIVERFDNMVVSIGDYQEKCDEVVNAFESMDLLDKQLNEIKLGYEDAMAEKNKRISELETMVEVITDQLATKSNTLENVQSEYQELQDLFKKMEEGATEIEGEEISISKAIISGIGHHLDENEDDVFDLTIELEWTDGYKTEVTVSAKMEDLDVEIQKVGFIMVDSEEYESLSEKAKGKTLSEIYELEEELANARKEIEALQYERDNENVAGISTADRYGNPKYYSSTIQNINEIFESEAPAKVLLITDNDGNYLTVGEENNLIAINVIDDRTVGSLSIVSANWLSKIMKNRKEETVNEDAATSNVAMHVLPVEYAVNGVATGVLPPQTNVDEEEQ